MTRHQVSWKDLNQGSTEKRRHARRRVFWTYFWAAVLVFGSMTATAFSFWASITPGHAAEPDISAWNERMFVACLNGKPIRVGEKYFTCSEMNLGTFDRRTKK
jgi:choline-glycine betaine transporter